MNGPRRWFAPWAATLTLAVGAAWACAWIVETMYELPLQEASFRFERPWAGLLVVAGVLALVARAYVLPLHAPKLRVSRGADLARLPRTWRQRVGPWLVGARAVALTLLAVALMGPQSIHARDRTDVEGIDIMLSLDVSLSMQAVDIEPNRFAATQAVVADFVARRPNDRIGAVVFGRDAYTLLPLTTDRDALQGMIRELQLGVVEGRGTAIGNGIATALNRLRPSRAKSKVIILLTDGDSNSGNLSPTQAAEYARAMNVKVYSILMGEADDARVQRGTDLFGRPLFDRGNFPINPDLLRDVSTKTGGEFFLVSDRRTLERTFHTILDRLERTEIEDLGRTYGELFPAFAIPALVLLLLEGLVGAWLVRRWP